MPGAVFAAGRVGKALPAPSFGRLGHGLAVFSGLSIACLQCIIVGHGAEYPLSPN